MPTKANKGEWSEFYAFLKILSDRKLPAADSNLSVMPWKFFIFHKIIREELPGEKKFYDIEWTPLGQVRVLDNNKDLLYIFDDLDLPIKTQKIFESIKNAGKWTFYIEEAWNLMNELSCTKIKASWTRKEDIVWIIDDRISQISAELGFSIKSMIGGSSTLLNAWDTTNFVFKIEGFRWNKEDINKIQWRSKIRDRVSKIKEMWWELIFIKPKNPIFSGNLRKIDTVFWKIIANMLLDFYSGNGSKISDLTKKLSESTTLWDFWFSANDYDYKIKNFLDAVALWMVPWKEWDGISIAQWGYIVVKENGEVICYHLYNRDEFRTYLFENTKFETASSSRHGFGSIYEDWWELFINLNLQVRF